MQNTRLALERQLIPLVFDKRDQQSASAVARHGICPNNGGAEGGRCAISVNFRLSAGWACITSTLRSRASSKVPTVIALSRLS